MSATALVKIILDTALNWYVKPILDEDMKNKLFPESLDKKILDEVKKVSKKLDEVKDEVARLRIQPSRKAFNKQIDFYKKTVIPVLRDECGKKSPNIERLTELSEKLDSHCIDFSGEISNAWQIIGDKHESCDFSVRILFDLTRDMSSLYLAMLSWARGLFSIIPGKEYKIDTYDNYIKICIDEVPGFSNEYASKLATSRLGRIKFDLNVKSHEHWEHGHFVTQYDKVYCLYADSFSSSEKHDPFVGESIYKEINKEYSLLPWKPGRIEMALAAEKSERYKKEHKKRRKLIRKSINENIIKPNEDFLYLWVQFSEKKKAINISG